MPSRGYTTPDSLPYPNNVNDPADLPPENRALAEATQTALNKKVPSTRQILAGDGLLGTRNDLAADLTLSVRVKAPLRIVNDLVELDTASLGFSPNTHNHDGVYAPTHDHPYAAAAHGHAYADPAHTHNYRQLGMEKGEIDFGTIAPSTEVVRDIAKPAGSTVLISVQHSSTYLFATADLKSSTLCRVNVRNSATATTQYNVKVSYLIVNAAG